MNLNDLRVTGLSHKTSTLTEREKGLVFFKELPGILLSTCNRVELYQMTDTFVPEFPNAYRSRGKEVAAHLFRVAAGLDSQILGETEILGQVRAASLRAKEQGGLLAGLFQAAVEAGKKVRRETSISKRNVSIASVAALKAEKLLGESGNKKILLVGSGKIAENVLKQLLKKGFSLVWIANRTYGRAKELAQKIGGAALKFDHLRGQLKKADLLIASTSAPHFVIKKEEVDPRTKPLVIIDLAVPRDVEPEIGGIKGVKLINIDEIKEEIGFNLLKRQVEAVFAEKIIEEEVGKFCEKYALEPAPAGWR